MAQRQIFGFQITDSHRQRLGPQTRGQHEQRRKQTADKSRSDGLAGAAGIVLVHCADIMP